MTAPKAEEVIAEALSERAALPITATAEVLAALCAAVPGGDGRAVLDLETGELRRVKVDHLDRVLDEPVEPYVLVMVDGASPADVDGLMEDVVDFVHDKTEHLNVDLSAFARLSTLPDRFAGVTP